MHREEEARIRRAKEYIEQNSTVKLTAVARQFEVPRGRLQYRLDGRTSFNDRPPTNTKLCKPEEDVLCRYIDRLDAVNLAVRKEFIVDAANLTLNWPE